MNVRQEGAKMKQAGAEGLLCISSHARFEFSSSFCTSSSESPNGPVLPLPKFNLSLN